MNLFRKIEEHMAAPLPIKSSRAPSFYPSAASCRDENNPDKIHGACMRQQWYRCAGFAESNPNTAYSHYIFAAGNMWEDWLTEQCKQMGIWIANSVKWAIPEYYISGEIDILIRDEDGEPIIVENKTYNASNYQAKKEICGIAGARPTPKVQNAMQAALYLSYFSAPERGGIKKVLLTYMDRSCTGPDSQQQFEIRLNPRDGKTYINVYTTDSRGTPFSYDIEGVTMEGIFERYNELMESLQESTDNPPKADFMHIYPAETIEAMWANGEIAKTKYEKYQSNPIKYPIGYWACTAYCGYRDLCKNHKELTGEA